MNALSQFSTRKSSLNSPSYVLSLLLLSIFISKIQAQDTGAETEASSQIASIQEDAKSAAAEDAKSAAAEDAKTAAAEDAETAAAEDAETAAAEDDAVPEFVKRSIELDISTSTIEELVAWNLVLGLNSSGSKQTLSKQLLEHYGVSSGTAAAPGSSSDAEQITIESAERSKYITMEISKDEEESVIELTGRVKVSFTEKERNRKHLVIADSVVFNRENETISAIGNIEYVVDTDGSEERFTGDNLIFKTTDWTGIIFHGTSERSQEVKGQKTNFFFRGDNIIRPGSEIILLEGGKITSDKNEYPYYSLNATKIWITAPGEWGMLNGILYVGHIPVFYIPFYWKSGSDLIFNPVVGFQSRLGYYIQTTTYFAGAKDYGDQFAIMGFGDSGTKKIRVERDGLFVVRKPSKAGDPTPTENSFKYMLDVYTSLGAMTGFKGKFKSVAGMDMDLYASIGLSRSISSTDNVFFVDNGSVKDYWHVGYFGSLLLPFRWGLDLDITRGQWFMKFSSYSDRDYLKDFGVRKENFDWLALLLGEEDEPEDPNLISNWEWKIRGSQSLSVSNLSPWLSTVSLNTITASLNWATRSNSNPELKQSTYNPGRIFFYPEKFILPDLKLTLAGALPDLTIPMYRTSNEIEKEPKDSKKDTEEDKEFEELKFSNYHPALSRGQVQNAVVGTFSYNIKGVLNIESQSDNSKWKQPEDIKFKFKPSNISTHPTATANYKLNLFDNLISLSGYTVFSLRYQTQTDLFSSGLEISDETRLTNYKRSKMNWENRITALSFNPFKNISTLSGSNLTYALITELFRKEFDSTSTVKNPVYKDIWISDEDEYFKEHSLSATFQWKPGIFNISSTAKTELPPKDEKHTFSGTLGVSQSNWSTSLSQSISYVKTRDRPWNFEPLSFNASWNAFDKKLKLSQNLTYDLQENRMKSAQSTLKVWDLSFRFTANHGKSYKWNKTTFVWEETGEDFSADSFELQYNLTGKKYMFWKNRITTSTTSNIKWNTDLRNITVNKLTFTLSQNLAIYKFIDLKFSISARNNSMFLYFPAWRKQLGLNEKYDFFTDLFKSFNLFQNSGEDRTNSQFNMESLSLAVVHHLGNWDLTVEYSGSPFINKGKDKYEWKSKINISLKWNPLPIFNHTTKFKDDEWSVESFKADP